MMKSNSKQKSPKKFSLQTSNSISPNPSFNDATQAPLIDDIESQRDYNHDTTENNIESTDAVSISKEYLTNFLKNDPLLSGKYLSTENIKITPYSLNTFKSKPRHSWEIHSLSDVDRFNLMMQSLCSNETERIYFIFGELSRISIEIVCSYHNLSGTNLTSSDIIDILRKHFINKNNRGQERYNFMNMRQTDDDRVQDYYVKLRTAANGCEWGEIEESLIVDALLNTTKCSSKIPIDIYNSRKISADEVLETLSSLENRETPIALPKSPINECPTKPNLSDLNKNPIINSPFSSGFEVLYLSPGLIDKQLKLQISIDRQFASNSDSTFVQKVPAGMSYSEFVEREYIDGGNEKYTQNPLFKLIKFLAQCDNCFWANSLSQQYLPRIPVKFDELVEKFKAINPQIFINFDEKDQPSEELCQVCRYIHMSILMKLQLRHKEAGSNNFTVQNAADNVSGLKRYNTEQIIYTPDSKKKRFLTRDATTIMMKWLREHRNNPYPNEYEKEQLLRQTGIKKSQLNYWFVNARRRIMKSWSSNDSEKIIENDSPPKPTNTSSPNLKKETEPIKT